MCRFWSDIYTFFPIFEIAPMSCNLMSGCPISGLIVATDKLLASLVPVSLSYTNFGALIGQVFNLSLSFEVVGPVLNSYFYLVIYIDILPMSVIIYRCQVKNACFYLNFLIWKLCKIQIEVPPLIQRSSAACRLFGSVWSHDMEVVSPRNSNYLLLGRLIQGAGVQAKTFQLCAVMHFIKAHAQRATVVKKKKKKNP